MCATVSRLEEALGFIAAAAMTAQGPSASRKTSLASGKAQASIKYLAFLAEGKCTAVKRLISAFEHLSPSTIVPS